MGLFVVYNLLSQTQARITLKGVTKWFAEHPDREDCRCDFFTVRRDHIAEDILKASVPGAKLAGSKDKPKKKAPKKAPKKTPKKKTPKK